MKRVQLQQKLWYVEINVKVEIRRYWWIEEVITVIEVKNKRTVIVYYEQK